LSVADADAAWPRGTRRKGFPQALEPALLTILIPIASLRQLSVRSPVLARITGGKTPLPPARCLKAAQKTHDFKGLNRKLATPGAP
jgi:hypothetical protein